MSLDVYLHPNKCPHCGRSDDGYWANITHNLGRMADEAGIGDHLWNPEKLGITKAGQLIEPLKAGLEKMKANPEHFKKFDAPNGWGRYVDFVPWIEEYLAACTKDPEAEITVSR